MEESKNSAIIMEQAGKAIEIKVKELKKKLYPF